MPLQPTTSELKKAFSSNFRSNILTRETAIDRIAPSPNYIFKVDNSISLPVGLPDSSLLYKNEKSSNVDRFAVPKTVVINGEEQVVYESFYFKPCTRTMELYDKMVSNAILGMHAVPHEPYAVSYCGRNGFATIDLTNLRDASTQKPIHSIRLDILLNSLGYAPDTITFMDLQTLFYDNQIDQVMDRRAFAQYALGTFFLANILGEVDPNSRNLIFLENPNAKPMDRDMAVRLFGEQYKTGELPKKFGFGVRIDTDENTHDSAKNRVIASGKIMGRSILFPNESLDSPMKLSLDDKEILYQYCQNPHFIVEGSFIPPSGMTEKEYISQIKNDEIRIKKAREIFKNQLLESDPELKNDILTLDDKVEKLMDYHGVYAKKKSFLTLIKEKNPNIDWGLFEELLTIADSCVSDTIIALPLDSLCYRHLSAVLHPTETAKKYITAEEFQDFSYKLQQSSKEMFHLLSSALGHYSYSSHKLFRLDEPASQAISFEPIPVDKKGKPVLVSPSESTSENDKQ